MLDPVLERTLKLTGPSSVAIIGQVIGQVCLVGVTPIVTRLYDPVAYGLFQTGYSIALVILPAVTQRLELVIPADRSVVRATSLLRKGWSFTIVTALVIAISAVVALFAQRDIGQVLSVVALALVALAATVLDNAVLIRAREMRRLGVRNLLSGVIAALLQVSLGFIWPDGISLAISIFAGRLIAVACTHKRMAPGNEIVLGGDYVPIPTRRLSSAASGVVGNLVVQAPLIVISVILGPAAAGIVGIAQRIAGVPMSLLGQGVGQVVGGRWAHTIRNQPAHLYESVRRSYLLLLLVAIAISIGVALIGVYGVEWLLGSAWARSGIFAAILALPFAFQLVASPATPLFSMTGRQRQQLILDVTRAGLGIPLIAVVALASSSLLWTTLTWGSVLLLSYSAIVGISLRSARRFSRAVAPLPISSEVGQDE